MKFPFKLKDSADFDVVGFGTNAVDYLIRVPAYPSYNSKLEITHYTMDAGGEAATTVVGLQRLGWKTAYAGRFGSDNEGDFGLQSLSDVGVDVSYTEQVVSASTQIAFIIIDERTGERTVLWHRDKKLAFVSSEAPLEAAARCRILHLTPHDVDASIAMAAKARENGVVVSSDIDNDFDGIVELLPLIDIFTATPELCSRITGHTGVDDALREITSRFGCGVAGVTLGRAGSLFYCDGALIETPGFEVPGGCIDTTGAGDAFRTGLLHAVLSGETIEEAARMANAVAALKCRAPGARAGLPDKHDLTLLIK